MKKQKVNLANIQGKLSRKEMKNINGGDRCHRISCCMAPQSPGCVPGTCEHPCGYIETCTCQRPIQ
jgi:hypothetical protein